MYVISLTTLNKPYDNPSSGSVIIVGATSGIGFEVARRYLQMGYRVGLCARHVERLGALVEDYPSQAVTQPLDVLTDGGPEAFRRMCARMGQVHTVLYCPGIGYYNDVLEAQKELDTVAVNVEGFVRMLQAITLHMAVQGGGHVAVITSIAGTKGLGAAPAYSASKAFQSSYLDALDQLSVMRRWQVTYTDIRPGFVRTPLLAGDDYPMLMTPDHVAEQIVRAIHYRKRVCTIDWRYRLLVMMWRCVPRLLWRRLPVRRKN